MHLPPKPFKVTVRHRPSVGIIELHGEIVSSTEEALSAAYVEATNQHAATVLLNFNGVDYINSGGIARIVSLIRQAHQSGRVLLACGLSEYYSELFEIAKLTDFIDVYPDEATALAAVEDNVFREE